MTDAHPTFSWAGLGKQEGTQVYYDSFQLSGELYSVGDCVYLLPMEDGAPPYIARLTKAYEETTAIHAEKLVIEVQWFERRSSVPPGIGALMSEAEVVESDLRDMNLVGCIDRKAVVIRADSFTQAYELLPAAKRQGEWHFCRGMLLSETQQFKTYQELGQQVYGEVVGIHHHHQQQQQFTMYPLDNGYSNGHALHLGNVDMPSASAAAPITVAGHGHHSAASAGGPAASSAANSRSRRAAAAARVAAAAAAAGGSTTGVRGVLGKVCCECGATQTPQWREGPLGPKTLCNACGVRYQRSQSKAKSNKRTAADKSRGSPQHGRAPKQACLSRLSANSSAAGLSPTAAVAVAASGGFSGIGLDLSNVGHSHGTRSNANKGAKQQQQRAQHRNGLYLGGDHHTGLSSSSSHHHNGMQQQQQRGGLSHGDGLHYYADEGSPPNMHTHILEEADDGDEGLRQQLPLRETLNRTATYEAADTLQSLSAHHQQQQHQQVAAAAHHAVSAAFCSGSVIGSPSSNMLLSDQLQAPDMPLLSLDDKDAVLPELGGADGLDAGLRPHSLSPIKPRAQQLTPSAATHCSSRLGAAASAVCASPGRLIAAMVQGLKLPTPLSLNTASHHSAASTVATPPVPSLLPSAAVTAAPPAASVPPLAAGTANGWASVTGNGLLMPVICSSSNMTPSSGTTPTAAAAAAAAMNGMSCLPGSADSHAASATVSSCETAAAAAAAAGSNGLTPNSLNGTPTDFAAAVHCQLQQHGSIGNSNSCMLSQLRSLVFRASGYAPDIQGLGGLYPKPSSPRAMQNLVHQLEQLPHTARLQLQQVSAILEDNLSKAKAADAAVIAVTQVLAAKKQAAADARQEVENSILHFKQMLGHVSPSVAAAAAGNVSSSTYCSPVPTPVAAGPGRCCMTSGGSGCLLPPPAVTAAGLLAPVCCGSDDCLVGSSRLGGNSPRVLVTQGFSSHPTQGFDISTDNLGRSGVAAECNLGHDGACEDHSGADDLIRDPEEGAAAAADLAVGAGPAKQQQQLLDVAEVTQQDQNQLDHHHRQQCSADGPCCDMQTASIALQPTVKAEQDAMDIDQQRQQQQRPEPLSASGSSDGPTLAAAAAKQQQQQQVAHVNNSHQLKSDSALKAGATLGPVRQPAAALSPPLPPTSAAHPAAEAAFVAA